MQNYGRFFCRLDEVKDVCGAVVEAGKVYDIIYKTCGCPLHTQANVSSGKLEYNYLITYTNVAIWNMIAKWVEINDKIHNNINCSSQYGNIA